MSRAIEIQQAFKNMDNVVACELETEFSWSSCEICNSSLGGSRHAIAQIFPGTSKEPIYYSVCVDCYVFAANGDLPEED